MILDAAILFSRTDTDLIDRPDGNFIDGLKSKSRNSNRFNCRMGET